MIADLPILLRHGIHLDYNNRILFYQKLFLNHVSVLSKSPGAERKDVQQIKKSFIILNIKT